MCLCCANFKLSIYKVVSLSLWKAVFHRQPGFDKLTLTISPKNDEKKSGSIDPLSNLYNFYFTKPL